jgi:Flp pilus assembly protein TadD
MSGKANEGAYRRIRALIDLGRVEAAHRDARQCLAQEPKDPVLLELVGLCLIRLKQPGEAVEALRASCAEGPERPHPHYLLGFASRESKEGDAALSEFREAVRLSPDEPVYLRALAELLADRLEKDEALALARRAVQVAPDTATNHVTLGYVASAAGQVELARNEYRAAVALDPNDSTAWNNLGCIEMAAGDKLSARERFREALRLDPRGERAQRNLQLVVPASRPPMIYNDFDAFLGEALRELRDAGRLGPMTRMLALVQTVGRPAVRAAITGRAESNGPGSRISVAAGAAVATYALRVLGPTGLVPLGALAATAGVGWLMTNKKVTPLRRKYAEHARVARLEWDQARRDWLDGKSSRSGRDQAIDRVLERLCVAIDREPISGHTDAP